MFLAREARGTPDATGTLASTPLAHVLVYAKNKRLTGSLELEASTGRASLDFFRGNVAAVATTPPTTFFGGVVYELGFIDAKTLGETLAEVAESKKPHGEILVARGAITTAQRDTALLEQMCRKVHHIFGLPAETTYAFYEGRAAAPPPIVLDVLAPVWRGLRDAPPAEHVTSVLLRYEESLLRAEPAASFSALDLSDDEKAIVRILRTRPVLASELRTATKLRTERVDLLLYVLLISKCVEPVREEDAPPSSMRDPAASGAVRAVLPSMSFRVHTIPETPPGMEGPAELGPDGIRDRVENLERLGLYGVLGLPDGSPTEAVRAAYFRLAKLWHPHHVPPELASRRADVQRVFDAMSLAHRTLTDAVERKKYGSSGRPTMPRDRGEMVRDADLALARRDFASAEANARALLEVDPRDAEALALVAWSVGFAGEGPDAAKRAALAMLDRAVSLDARCDRALTYRGVLRRKSGDAEGAKADFARAVQANPKNLDARRELARRP